MTSISRRRFLTSSALSLAAIRLRAQGAGAQVALKLPAEATGPHMPADFIGLSYEVQQLADPSSFSASNTGLIRAFKGLTSRNVLRLGGNTSEFVWWKPAPNSPEPEHPQTRVIEGEPKAQYYAVTPKAVRNLAGFLKATGWTCLYGIGMGTKYPSARRRKPSLWRELSARPCSVTRLAMRVDLARATCAIQKHGPQRRTWRSGSRLLIP